MPETVSGLVTATRAMLDEVTGRQWTNTNIKRWLYEGMKDLARKTKALKKQADIAITAGTIDVTLTAASFTPNTSFLAIRNAWWVPGGGDPRVVPLDPVPFDAGDQYWGSYPSRGSATPAIFTVRGYAPNWTLRVYPAPGITSTIRVYGAALPTIFPFDESVDNSTIDIFDGWEDALIDYACMKAFLADRDGSPTGWMASQALYNQKVGDLIQNQSVIDVNDQFTYAGPIGGVPSWISGPWY